VQFSKGGWWHSALQLLGSLHCEWFDGIEGQESTLP